MMPKDLKKLVKTMRDLGVTHFKDASIELNITPEPPAKLKPLTKAQEEDIKNKLEKAASIMGLGDEELLDRLFPAPPEEQSEALI